MRLRGTQMLLAGALAAGLALLPAGPAVAAPPSNDDFDDAVPLSSVPFEVTADTSEATRAGDDPECIGDDGFTVWYALQLNSTVEIVLDTFGSDYDTTLSAWTGPRGSLEPVACNDDTDTLQSRIRFLAEAGVTYHLMVGAFPESPGGNLVLSGRELPPAVELAVSLDPTGSVSGGAATIGGTVDCSRPVRVDLVGTLRQQVGSRVTVGSFRTPVDCTGADRWRATVLGETGNYRRGTANGVAVAQFNDPDRDEVVQARVTGSIRLR